MKRGVEKPIRVPKNISVPKKYGRKINVKVSDHQEEPQAAQQEYSYESKHQLGLTELKNINEQTIVENEQEIKQRKLGRFNSMCSINANSENKLLQRPYHKYYRFDKQNWACHLPSFLRIQVNNITSFKPQQKQAVVDLSIFLTVYLGPENKQINVQYFDLDFTESIKNFIHMQISSDQVLQEQKEQMAVVSYFDDSYFDEQQRLFHFKKSNKNIKLTIQPEVFLTPFEKLILRDWIRIRSIYHKFYFSEQGQTQKTVDLRISFDLLDNQEMTNKIIQKRQIDVGDYKVAPSLLSLKFLKHEREFQKLMKQEEQHLWDFGIDKQKQRLHFPDHWITQIKNIRYSFNEARLKIYLHKDNEGVIGYITSFIGFTIILSLLTLAVFFQSNDIAGKVASVATIAVAFGTTILSVRQSNVYKQGNTLIEYLIFVQMISSMIPLLQTVVNRDQEDYKFDWRTNQYFLTTLGIQVSILCVSLLLILYHFCYLVPFHYNKTWQIEWQQRGYIFIPSFEIRRFKYQDLLKQFIRFNPNNWKNQQLLKLI